MFAILLFDSIIIFTRSSVILVPRYFIDYFSFVELFIPFMFVIQVDKIILRQ